MAVRLGPLVLEHPFILAPMAGITDSAFRRLMRRKRAALVVSELVSVNGIEHGGQKTFHLLKFAEEERPIGLQLFGDDDDLLVKAALRVQEMGADFVDLNMGCPVPKVVKRGAGAAMCKDLPRLGQLLERFVKAVRIPVSIKIRSGWDENSINVHDVVHVAQESGVAWIAVHGRTRAQGYSGSADWNLIGEVKARARIPVIGNGDVATAEVALTRLKETGVDAVMIGRGALRNPFLFAQCEALWLGRSVLAPTSADYLKLLEEHRQILQETFAPRFALVHARKFLSWYAAGIPGCHQFRRTVFTTEDSEALWKNAFEFFGARAGEKNFRDLGEGFLLGGHG